MTVKRLTHADLKTVQQFLDTHQDYENFIPFEEIPDGLQKEFTTNDKLLRAVKSSVELQWYLLCKGRVTSSTIQGIEYLTLPAGKRWLAGSDESPEIIVRKCYIDLFNRTTSGVAKKLLIGGTSGIGKSVMSWYFLYRIAEAARASGTGVFIVFHSQRDWWYYLRSSGETVVVNRDNIHPEAAKYCIVDIGQNFVNPNWGHLHGATDLSNTTVICIASAVSEAAAIPKLKGDLMAGYLTSTMPVWTYDEIMTGMRSVYGANDIDETRVKALFVVFGGSFRHFRRSYQQVRRDAGDLTDASDPTNAVGSRYGELRDKFLKEVDAMVANELANNTPLDERRQAVGLAESLKTILEGQCAEQQFNQVWNTLEHKTPKDPDMRMTGSTLIHTFISSGDREYRYPDYRAASPFCQLILDHFEAAQAARLEEILNLLGASTKGVFHELRGHRKLKYLTLTEVNVRCIPWGGTISDGKRTLNLRSSYQRFHTLEAARRMASGVYGMPMTCNFPVVDAIIQPNILVQFTVAAKHSLRDETRPRLEELRECLRGDRETHVLLWVVDTKAACADFESQSGFYTEKWKLGPRPAAAAAATGRGESGPAPQRRKAAAAGAPTVARRDLDYI